MKKPIVILVSLLCLLFFIISCDSKNKITTKKSIAEAIAVLPNATIDETIDYYYKLKREQLDSYNFEDENELNKLGYQFLNNGKVKEAIKIFQLLVSEFPNAYNPYDSLAEAYLIDGNEPLAIKNYEKSLKLNPKNINAEDHINKLKYKEYDSTRFYKVYAVEKYKQDLDELGRRLTEVNPNAFKFITEHSFWDMVNSKKESLSEKTTFSEFIWMCSEIIASISCSHTSMGYFKQERKMLPVELRFPLEVRLINNKMYVSNALNNKDKVSVKQEITAINDRPIAKVKDEIYKHISSQGSIETSKKNFLNAHSTSIIPYALGFPNSYNVHIKNKKEPISLSQLVEYDDNLDKLPDYLCQEPLCIKYLEDNKTAIMTIRTFAYYGNKFPEFKSFIDSSFKAFSQKKITNLVIDVRGNGGGPSDAGIYLLKYLSDKPFRYFSNSQYNEKLDVNQPFTNSFKGNLYFTMDGNGGSTTGHFMSLIKHLKLATLVGEELGSNQFCTGGQKMLRLPNTGIIYVVARNTYETTATDLPIDRGIMPDYEVSQSIDDYLDNVDMIMDYTLKLIKKN
ncbi:S41 family peptidase [Aquimarina sp. 2201CG5-10]|uniref:S41 family peptidase n=1 Tax=Aquimarina callyspongiae TaxID=3098150 RepID=UPI002AB48E0A|nr:S41 family peptidase [Aquimarina sp. 2201CG5-10]MDY8135959.1 S41 family peptidase [Aquimarina sp. 2201CG5-10]